MKGHTTVVSRRCRQALEDARVMSEGWSTEVAEVTYIRRYDGVQEGGTDGR